MNSFVLQAVLDRLDSLTKPKGSLGRLEELALRFAVARDTVEPSIGRKAMFIFCADHGVAAEGVSAYPSEVTRQMVVNFLRGGAAISVLCRRFDIKPVIVDAGVAGEAIFGTVDRRIAPGTQNLAQKAAMTQRQAHASISHGIQLGEAAAEEFNIAGIGEMGIGNTTSAAALLCVFAGCDPSRAAGRGTGLNDVALARKASVIRSALQLHKPVETDPVGALAAVGGFEIGEMAGFLIGAHRKGLPVVIDGFIAGSAALLARALDPACLDSVFFSHYSSEHGHRLMIQALEAEPYLDLGMRLGEGTGAALVINLIETSVDLYTNMATFGEAKVSQELK